MVDLKEQGRVYLDRVVERVDVESVVGKRSGISVGTMWASAVKPTRVNGWWVAVTAAVAVLGLVGVVGLLADSEEVAPAVSPEVTDVIRVGDRPHTAMVAADGAIWVVTHGGVGSVVRIDAETLQVTDTIPVGMSPQYLIPAEDGLWVLDTNGRELFLIDSSTRQVTDSIQILFTDDGNGQAIEPVLVDQTLWVHTNPSGPGAVASVVEVDLAKRELVSETPVGFNAAWWVEAIDGAIWSWAPGDGLRRFDLETHQTDTFSEANVGYQEGCCIAVGDAIWMFSHGGFVIRFDVGTREITDRIELDEDFRAAVAGAGAVWVLGGKFVDPADPGVPTSVYRIDLESRQITDVIPVSGHPNDPLFADGAIWVTNAHTDTITRIDAETREVTHIIPVGPDPETPSWLNGAIWVPDSQDGTLTRIETK